MRVNSDSVANGVPDSGTDSDADDVSDCGADSNADGGAHSIPDGDADRAAHGCADCGVHPGQVHHGALVQRPQLRGLWCWRVQRDLQRGKLHCMRERTFRLR